MDEEQHKRDAFVTMPERNIQQEWLRQRAWSMGVFRLTSILLLICLTSCSYFQKEIVEPVIESVPYSPPEEYDPEPFVCFDEFASNFEALFETFANLFTEYTLSHADCEIEALYQTVADMGGLLKPFFNQNSIDRFVFILSRHLDLSLDSNFTEPQQEGNILLLVEFLNIMNPYFSYVGERWLFEEWVMVQNRMVRAYSANAIQEAEILSDRYADLSKEIARRITLAFKKQFLSTSVE